MGPRRPHHASDHVAGYLATNEHVVLEMKQHWARVLPAVGSCVLGLVLVLVAGFAAPAWMGALTNAAWWIWLVLLAHLGYRLLEWWDETFVITNKRLILVHGLLVKKVAMMPLSKVTDMSYNRSPAARLLGYGTFVMESAGQVQALDVIDYVRDPNERYRQICTLIFGTDDPDDGWSEPDEERDEPLWDAPQHDSWDAPAWDDSRDATPRRDDATPRRPRVTRGRGHHHDRAGRTHDGETLPLEVTPRSVDDTDPYGMVTAWPPNPHSDPHHTYGVEHDADAGWVESDDESAWSVSREHATSPQSVRRDRHLDTPSTWHDDA